MSARNAGLWLIAVAMVASTAQAAEVMRTENSHLDIGGHLQVIGSGQMLEDPVRDDTRMYLFLNQGRLFLDGSKEGWRYRMNIAFGGEAEVKAPTPGISLNLLDMYVDAPLAKNVSLRFGQYKVPYGRERLTDPSQLLFAERSVQNLGSRIGRDVGATLAANFGPAMLAAGVFTGGGTNIPVRDIPLSLGTPMFVARAGLQSKLDEDVFAFREKPARVVDALMAGVFVNAMYTKDSEVGHSSVLRTKASEKSLLLNSNWNPLLNQAPVELGSIWQAGADAVVRAPVGPGALSAELEANFAKFENRYGAASVIGARGQVGYGLKKLPLEFALRYSVLLPSEKFENAGTSITGREAIHQITPAIVYSAPSFGLRIIGDVPVQLSAPTVVEEGVGKYVLTQQIDQASLLGKGGTLGKENVFAARLMLQADF